MKKLLLGLLLVSSLLSFGAQRVPYEKLSVTFEVSHFPIPKKFFLFVVIYS